VRSALQLWSQRPRSPLETNPSHSCPHLDLANPRSCSRVLNPSTPQPLTAMHVIKRGEGVRGGLRVGEEGEGTWASAARAVTHGRGPHSISALPAAPSRAVSQPGLCRSRPRSSSRPSVRVPSALPFCCRSTESLLPCVQALRDSSPEPLRERL
jgi:hypothetical protein